MIRRIQERYDYYVKVYTFYERKIKIKLCNTNSKKYVLGFLIVDLFHFTWAIIGLIYSVVFDSSDCQASFEYIAMFGAILIGFGIVFILRMAYTLTFFYFGKKIFDHYEELERQRNTLDIKFRT